MSYGETQRLVDLLLKDPASQIAAAVAGWKYPVSWEFLAAAVTLPAPFPRPFDLGDKSKFGKHSFTPEEARALLAARGPAKD